jgi:hypothetical protein
MNSDADEAFLATGDWLFQEEKKIIRKWGRVKDPAKLPDSERRKILHILARMHQWYRDYHRECE